jgi:hypothetical protein
VKKLLLTGIAALFLATGTAHAAESGDFNCDQLPKYYLGATDSVFTEVTIAVRAMMREQVRSIWGPSRSNTVAVLA